jgi:hypothetical protein
MNLADADAHAIAAACAVANANAAMSRPVLHSVTELVAAALAIVDELPDDSTDHPLAEIAITQILLERYDLSPGLHQTLILPSPAPTPTSTPSPAPTPSPTKGPRIWSSS